MKFGDEPKKLYGEIMYPFRVFISYAHEDRPVVEQLDRILIKIGFVTIWDRDISPGAPFTDVIKKQIATAHIFMPLITKNSQGRPWVHQETGFAIGIDIPVLPIALTSLPGEMLVNIQAICVKEDLSDLEKHLLKIDFEKIVLSVSTESELQRLMISDQVAEYSEERTKLLLRYIQNLPQYGRVRQRAIFSSFSLPRKMPRDIQWKTVDPTNKKSEFHRDLLRREREILEKHARESGCSLIINPIVDPRHQFVQVHRTQLAELLDFVKSMADDKLIVVTSSREFSGNLILVGDWIGARADSPKIDTDYRQTRLSAHAPTVLRWVQEFEHELNENLALSGLKPEQTRMAAISKIQEMLDKLHSEQT